MREIRSPSPPEERPRELRFRPELVVYEPENRDIQIQRPGYIHVPREAEHDFPIHQIDVRGPSLSERHHLIDSELRELFSNGQPHNLGVELPVTPGPLGHPTRRSRIHTVSRVS